jgi:mRNA-degrading endonuclease RelE of RelBE toxin-antitoxin system
MVRNIWRSPDFIKETKKLKDNLIKDRIKKQINKILQDPNVGKPLIYSFDDSMIYFLKFEHRKKVYND